MLVQECDPSVISSPANLSSGLNLENERFNDTDWNQVLMSCQFKISKAGSVTAQC